MASCGVCVCVVVVVVGGGELVDGQTALQAATPAHSLRMHQVSAQCVGRRAGTNTLCPPAHLDGDPLVDARAQADDGVVDVALAQVGAVADNGVGQLALDDLGGGQEAWGGVDGALGVVELEVGGLQGGGGITQSYESTFPCLIVWWRCEFLRKVRAAPERSSRATSHCCHLHQPQALSCPATPSSP